MFLYRFYLVLFSTLIDSLSDKCL